MGTEPSSPFRIVMLVVAANTLHKKWSFALKISSVNVTKSAGNGGFSHLLKKSLMENFIFCTVKIAQKQIWKIWSPIQFCFIFLLRSKHFVRDCRTVFIVFLKAFLKTLKTIKIMNLISCLRLFFKIFYSITDTFSPNTQENISYMKSLQYKKS